MSSRKDIQNLIYAVNDFLEWWDDEGLPYKHSCAVDVDLKLQEVQEAFDEIDEDLMAKFGLFFEGTNGNYKLVKDNPPARPV